MYVEVDVVVAVLVFLATPAGAALGGIAAASPVYKNCTNLNKKYPHGLGKVGARHKSASGTPVTTFKGSTRLYTAMSHNRGLDRDKDGVACEGVAPRRKHGPWSQ